MRHNLLVVENHVGDLVGKGVLQFLNELIKKYATNLNVVIVHHVKWSINTANTNLFEGRECILALGSYIVLSIVMQ